MPQRNRDQAESTWFHVYSRGADRQDIYSRDSDHHVFEALLSDTIERFRIEVHAYALMSNHFHLLIHDPAGELSAAMQYLLSRYAKRYNHTTERSGPLFDQRFGCVAIEADGDGAIDRHLATAGRYVHRNPLAFVPASAIGAYRFTSLGVYLGRRDAPSWLTTAALSELIDPATYLAVILDITRDDLIEPQAWDGHVRVAFDDLVRVVSECSFTGASGRPAAKTMLVMLALELRALPVEDIAGRLGVSMSSVRRIGRRGRVRLVDDAPFAQCRLEVIDRLVTLKRPPDTRGEADVRGDCSPA